MSIESLFLQNRFIRNYLHLFNENKWKEVIKYTFIYGIQSLQCHYNLTQLSTQKLEEIVKNSNFIITAEDFENGEAHRLRALKSNADYLTSEMGIDPGYFIFCSLYFPLSFSLSFSILLPVSPSSSPFLLFYSYIHISPERTIPITMKHNNPVCTPT